ncbi:MAG: hypothetical protein NVS9B6_02640 [Candidatus Limnocylindrales bacterium]
MRHLIVAALSIGFLIASGPAASAAPPGYPPLRWLPAAAENFAAGRAGATIGTVVIHATEGTYAGAISWFRDPAANASAHYVIRAADGEITQLVAEADTAFHVRGSNRASIGIEHEFDPDHGQGYTDALYRSSASLVCAITRRYGIPADRAHIRGHSEMPGTDHTDPGPSWDWNRYMSFVSACAGPSSSVAPPASAGSDAGFTPCRSAACVPDPGLADGSTGPAVALLQADLAALGRMSQATVRAGVGQFGPRTMAAVRAFQEDNGLPVTGYYGPLTAAALTRALSSLGAADDVVLVFGDRSSAITELQRDLGRLGYLGTISGYFGPATRDAVRRFQRDHGIPTTGNYGPLTRAEMRRARP